MAERRNSGYAKTLPPWAKLHRLFKYNPDSGSLRWRYQDPEPSQGFNARFAGQIAGWVDTTTGYRAVMIDGIGYGVHRIIFKMMNEEVGDEPYDVDHKDGDKENNRLDNLRPASRMQNTWNRKISSVNTTGVKGVYPWTSNGVATGKFAACVTKNGKKYHCGVFSSIELAAQAVQSKREQLHGEFARHE